MRTIEVPRLGERCLEHRLPNGLTIRVVPKPGFARKYAFFAVNYGSIDTKFTLEGREIRTPDGVAHYLEHKMFDLPDGDAMERFAAAGASPNAFTSYDMTAFARRSAYSSAREFLTVQQISLVAPSPSAAIFFASVRATSCSAS